MLHNLPEVYCEICYAHNASVAIAKAGLCAAPVETATKAMDGLFGASADKHFLSKAFIAAVLCC